MKKLFILLMTVVSIPSFATGFRADCTAESDSTIKMYLGEKNESVTLEKEGSEKKEFTVNATNNGYLYNSTGPIIITNLVINYPTSTQFIDVKFDTTDNELRAWLESAEQEASLDKNTVISFSCKLTKVE